MKTKLITGRYKGYEVCYANKGQIFPRDGYYLTKGNDVIYLEDAMEKTREETIREIEESNKDYLKKLCWTDIDIRYFLRQYNKLKK